MNQGCRYTIVIFAYSFLYSISIFGSEKSSNLTFGKSLAVGIFNALLATVSYAPFSYWHNQTIRGLKKEKNPRIWFRGTKALAVSNVPNTALQVVINNTIERTIYKNSRIEQISTGKKFATAGTAGALASIFGSLAGTVAMHQQTNNLNMRQTIATFPGGYRDLPRALSLAMARDALIAMGYLALIPYIVQATHNNIQDKKQATLAGAAGAAATGIFKAVITQPLQTTRVAYIADIKTQKYASIGQLVKDMFKKEGLRSFYKGGVSRSTGLAVQLPALYYSNKLLSEQLTKTKI